jgi:hypothetical protein
VITPDALTPAARIALINSGSGLPGAPLPLGISDDVWFELYSAGLIVDHSLTHLGSVVRERCFRQALDELDRDLSYPGDDGR